MYTVKQIIMHTYSFAVNWGNHQKDQIILAPGRRILADFWLPHEIESCNFQNLLVFGFPETSQNLISLRQLLFIYLSKKPRNLPKLPQTGAKMIWFLVLLSYRCKLVCQSYRTKLNGLDFRSPRIDCE